MFKLTWAGQRWEQFLALMQLRPDGKPNILEMGSVESENTVNILDISSILVSCDLTGNSYLNGDLSAVLYSFFPGVGVGHKIIQRPSQPLIYQLQNADLSIE